MGYYVKVMNDASVARRRFDNRAANLAMTPGLNEF